MSGQNARRLASLGILVGAMTLGLGRLTIAKAKDQPPEAGPKVVILKELEHDYEPVPFDHLSHAKMAQMWGGCATCHHRPPEVTAEAAEHTTATVRTPKTQEESAEFPACKSCHSVSITDADIRKPSLKGAYHRQCLGCHREWMHENACVKCHQPKEGRIATHTAPAPDDIVGRMHPPIPEPGTVSYKTRFTPADGGNVLFRHMEHTSSFGIKCVNCHHKDSCSHCHGATGDTSMEKPLRPGMTWAASHGPCMGCHEGEHCRHCHYKDNQSPPKAFDHVVTGQGLNTVHTDLACSQCHLDLDFAVAPTCGDTSCHRGGRVLFSVEYPGPVTRPDPEPSNADAASSGTAKRPAGNDQQ